MKTSQNSRPKGLHNSKFPALCLKLEKIGTAMDTFGNVLDKNGIILDNFGAGLAAFSLRNVPKNPQKTALSR